MPRRPRFLTVAVLAAIAFPAVAVAQLPLPIGDPRPIQEGPVLPGADRPEFAGSPATARRVHVTRAPRHPHMAPNGASNLHEDGWQTDTSPNRGPLGNPMTRTSTSYNRECGSITFDRRGRLVTICVGVDRPVLKILEPRTLKEVASLDLPPRQLQPGASPFTSFAGGGYFYLDDRERVVTPTGDRHLKTIAVEGDTLRQVSDVDLTGVVPQDQGIISGLPDWDGTIWFASTGGVIGTVDPKTGTVRARDLKEKIGNSIAVDQTGGVYIVTDAALYRFDRTKDGGPGISWRQAYRNIGSAKPGQTQAGSGTTPTVMADGLVAITDNADPMRIVVMRTAKRLKGRRRVICRTPVFAQGASATDQSLIGAGRALVVENNSGYTGPASVVQGASTTPGMWRVDVRKDLRGCRVRWRNEDLRAPSSVPKLSLRTGLLYAYEKQQRSDGEDLWYVTALDFRTGRRLWSRLAGEGLGFNDNFAPITLGPDGTLYSGVLGGMVALREG
jgi:hypothetical protein